MHPPLPIAVVGLNFGRHIVDAIRTGPAAEHFRLAAVCDLDAAKSQAMADACGVPWYTDLKELLANPDIPCLALMTGPDGRATLIRQCIRAGKEVMTTKPFETDPQAALEVLQEARTAGRVVHLNSPSPTWTDDLRQVQAWRDEHDLGRPVGCRMEVTVRYNQTADGSWLDDPRRCPVAPIFRLGIYCINDMVRLLGDAEAVQVFHSRLFTGKPTPDNALLSIRFADGTLGAIYATFCCGDQQFYRNSMVLNFDRGTIYRNVGPMDGALGREATVLELAIPQGEADALPATKRAVLQAHSGEYQWDVFHRACYGETIPDAVSPETVVAGLKVIDAMGKAEVSGRTELV